MIGQLEQADGKWQLRFTRHLPHDPKKVWRAITEAEHLAEWFPHRIVGEWVTGGALSFEDQDQSGPVLGGEVLACEPPSLLEYRWGTDTLRFEIAASGADARWC